MSTLVMTIPHSGTHFLLKFLVLLGLDERSGFANYSPEGTGAFTHIHPRPEVFENCKFDIYEAYECCIMTLRHPHLSMRAGSFNGGTDIVGAWESMIEHQGFKKQLFLGLACEEKDRLPQLMAIAEHFGKATERYLPMVEKYAKDWTPLNSSLTSEDIIKLAPAVKAFEQWR